MFFVSFDVPPVRTTLVRNMLVHLIAQAYLHGFCPLWPHYTYMICDLLSVKLHLRDGRTDKRGVCPSVRLLDGV